MIEIRVLGSLEVRGPDGRIEIVSESQRRLVSVLALNAEAVVRGALLEDSLELSAGAVRTALSRLRRLLRAIGLWRGAPLSEFAIEPWASSEVTRLQEAHAQPPPRVVERGPHGRPGVTEVAPCGLGHLDQLADGSMRGTGHVVGSDHDHECPTVGWSER